MKEFDLIPDSYRVYLSKIKVFKISIFVLIIFIVVSSIALGAIEIAMKTTNKEIARLNSVNEMTRQQLKAFDELKLTKRDLDNKWNILNGLRSTPPPEMLLRAIDNALIDSQVWFTNLRFDRTENVNQDPELVDTGYFIVINPDKEQLSLSIGTKMTISGGAQNHSTLSEFVKKLLAQTAVLDAKVLQTSTNNNDKNINYVLEIIVNSRESAYL